MIGADAILRCLEEEGVSYIFGYPGATIAPFYESLSKSEKVKHILVRQEQNAAHMASGYARITGEVGVCVSTSGPGATNMVTGIATAYLDSIPMVAITGQVQSYLLGHDVFQEVDITGAVSPFIKHSYLIKDVKDIPRVFKEAFHIASTGRPGPVLIDIPIDIQYQNIDFKYPESVNLRGYKPSSEGNFKQIQKVCETISEAKRPLICAGGGVFSANAQAELQTFSEATGIPIVTTMMGLGILPTYHHLNVGMIGAFGHKTANKALELTDLLIIVGARVADRAITAPQKIEKQKRTIHIDIDPAEIGKNVSPTVPLVGDLKKVLTQMMIEMPHPDCKEWTDMIVNEGKAEKDKIPSAREHTISPKLLMKEIGKHIDENACVVGDVGQNQIWAAKYLPINKGRFMTSGGLGTMGYSIPAAIGVKFGDRDRQTLVVCGDGSFQMTGNELSTAVEHGCDIKVILLNNRTLGMVCEIQRNSNYNKFGVSMPDSPDFQKLADAYGIGSARITHDSDVEEAVKKMLAHKGPYILECIVAPEESTKTIYEVI